MFGTAEAPRTALSGLHHSINCLLQCTRLWANSESYNYETLLRTQPNQPLSQQGIHRALASALGCHTGKHTGTRRWTPKGRDSYINDRLNWSLRWGASGAQALQRAGKAEQQAHKWPCSAWAHQPLFPAWDKQWCRAQHFGAADPLQNTGATQLPLHNAPNLSTSEAWS